MFVMFAWNAEDLGSNHGYVRLECWWSWSSQATIMLSWNTEYLDSSQAMAMFAWNAEDLGSSLLRVKPR
jgi:hypothetical protein